ncbi:MAG: hypothetical protein ABSF65_08940 [Candidatus Bathyarchaeia archaeon]|jgi:hypothetical protein
MGRCTVTKGQHRIGRTIRKLEGSVELSDKESKAKVAEKNYRQKTQAASGYTDDSPIQNLRDPAKWEKTDKKQQ